MQRRQYHTFLKLMVNQRKCPNYILKQIPRTNIHRWKHQTNLDEIVDFGLRSTENLNTVFQGIEQAPTFYYSLVKIHLLLLNTFRKSNLFFELLKTQQQQIVHTIGNSKNHVSLNLCCRLFGISRHTYQEWKSMVDLPCNYSKLKKCLSNKPNQLTTVEVANLTDLLSDNKYAHWSIKSLCHWARRENLVFASISTWYKYNKLLAIRKYAKRYRKPKYEALRGTAPDEYWHADVSLFRTADGSRNYIYVVSDNFSRKVLSWHIDDHLSAELRTDTLKEAFELAHSKKNIKLIVDGGSENNNNTVEHFTSKNDIEKLIAQKDIVFSNSMVEAINKQLKYNWLFRKHIPDLETLRLELDKFFEEHNAVKPLDILNGYTPNEVYSESVNIFESAHAQELLDARKNRAEYNKSNRCSLCN